MRDRTLILRLAELAEHIESSGTGGAAIVRAALERIRELSEQTNRRARHGTRRPREEMRRPHVCGHIVEPTYIITLSGFYLYLYT